MTASIIMCILCLGWVCLNPLYACQVWALSNKEIAVLFNSNFRHASPSSSKFRWLTSPTFQQSLQTIWNEKRDAAMKEAAKQALIRCSIFWKEGLSISRKESELPLLMKGAWCLKRSAKTKRFLLFSYSSFSLSLCEKLGRRTWEAIAANFVTT